MTLRPYQSAAIRETYEWLSNNPGNPIIVIPTGGGKTPVIATMCRDVVREWAGRVLVLSHVKELLEQTRNSLLQFSDLTAKEIGIYSAGLGERSTDQPVILAGIQSVWQRMHEFGHRDLILIDECHLVPPEGDGMYRNALEVATKVSPQIRVVGLSATPYRTRTGLVYGEDQIFQGVSYEIGIRPLIEDGFLCPLKSKGGITQFDLSQVHTRGGEFIESEMQRAFDGNPDAVWAATQEFVALAETRKSVLVFTAGVEHAGHIADGIRTLTEERVDVVTGETSDGDRERAIEDFKRGSLRWLVNVNVLTTGFDAPNVDCVVLLRATKSPGLYYQMVGRGFRLHPGKADALVLDFGGNILRHGPVDELTLERREANKNGGEAPAKECEVCHAIVHAGCAKCPECGHVFPEPKKAELAPEAETRGILAGQVSTSRRNVLDWWWTVHRKRGAEEGKPPTLRVTYSLGLGEDVNEYLCFEHTGYARTKAVQWWLAHAPPGVNIPKDVNEAWSAFRSFTRPESITIRETAGKPFPEVVAWHDDAVEEPAADIEGSTESAWDAFDEVPF